jgi:DNA-directed RNA polymerase subunit RPC12/RpoP
VAAFSLTCTTCRARLRVRDDSAIGQILACPKCGSMVLVQAPEPAAATPEVRATPLADPPPPVATPAPAPRRKSRFREDFPPAEASADAAVSSTSPMPQHNSAAGPVAAPPVVAEHTAAQDASWLLR